MHKTTGVFLFLAFLIVSVGFVYLEFVKYQLGVHRNVRIFVQYMHICYKVVLYTDMSKLSSYIEVNRISF